MARRKTDPAIIDRIDKNRLGTDPITYGEASCRFCHAPLTYALGPHLAMSGLDRRCTPTREIRCMLALCLIFTRADMANQ